MSDRSRHGIQGLLPLLLGVALLTPAPGHAQVPSGGGAGPERIDGRAKFVPVPYIGYNRSFGFSLGALPMVMFNPVEKDTLSPSSIAGLLGLYSTSETWFLMGFAQVFLDDDKWRLLGAGGTGSINFQFYLDAMNQWIPYNTAADFAFVEAQRRVMRKLYFGVNYVYMKFDTTAEPIPYPVGTTLNGLGLVLSADQRTSVYYPKDGFFSNIRYNTFPEAFGNDFTSSKVQLDYNHYRSIRRDLDVLAARAFVGLGIGDLSFNQQFIVGQRSDIRGYTQGEFRGNYLLAVQGEYRWNFHPRWGAVGFAGLATVFESINESDTGRILPGIGTGVRFTAFADTHMNVGLDAAVGRNDWGIYFRIGEAF